MAPIFEELLLAVILGGWDGAGGDSGFPDASRTFQVILVDAVAPFVSVTVIFEVYEPIFACRFPLMTQVLRFALIVTPSPSGKEPLSLQLSESLSMSFTATCSEILVPWITFWIQTVLMVGAWLIGCALTVHVNDSESLFP